MPGTGVRDHFGTLSASDAFRTFFRAIDTAIYWLITGIYEIFFNIATSQFMAGDVIKGLFSRIQLLFGIIILFRLAISLLSGIVNPDTLTSDKGGFGKIVTRIVISLVLVVAIVPLNISGDHDANSYEARLNNNGIIFGTLYQFQYLVLDNNVIGKLILNTNTQPKDATDAFRNYGNVLSSTVLKTFVTPNLINSDEQYNHTDDEAYLADPSNRQCPDDAATTRVETYLGTTNPSTILGLTSFNCGDYYEFNYSYLIAGLVGIVVLVLLLNFTIDVAIRVFKLIVLWLVAFVPIISYIDPKTGDEKLQTWGKMVLTTYIDLFLRVAVIYFVAFLTQVLFGNDGTGIVFINDSGAVNVFSRLFLIVGLLMFVKDAPKFIMDSLGIKSDGKFFRHNMGSLFRGTGAAVAGAAGLISGGITGWRASQRASRVNAPEGSAARINGNRFKAGVVAGISGIAGAGRGIHTGLDAKNGGFIKALDNQRLRNVESMNDAFAGGTWFGRAKNRVTGAFTGVDDLSKVSEEEAKANQRLTDAKERDAMYSAIKSMAEDKAKTTDKVDGTISRYGGIKFNYSRFMGQLQDQSSRGLDKFTYTDRDGHKLTIDMGTAQSTGFAQDVLDATTSAYMDATAQGAYKATDANGNEYVIGGTTGDVGLRNAIEYARSQDSNFQTAFDGASSAEKLGKVKQYYGVAKGDESAAQHEIDNLAFRKARATANVKNQGKG